MSNSTIKIKCETPELAAGFMQVMLTSKGQLVQFLGQTLGSQGISSDIKINISGNEIAITQKSGDKGKVFVVEGTELTSVKYSELPAYAKYLELKEGALSLYVKTPDNVDAHLGRFVDPEEAVANINSNDVVDAVTNIRKKYETKPEETNVAEELGTSIETV